MSDIRQRLDDLCQYIRDGKILEAMEEFYAEDCQMQENLNPPTVGLEACVENERKFLAKVKEFRNYEATALAAEGDVSFQECIFDYVTHDDVEVHQVQVARAQWRDGKIVHERFYYDPGTVGE